MPPLQMYIGPNPYEGAFTKATALFLAGCVVGAALTFLGMREAPPPTAVQRAVEIAPPGLPVIRQLDGARAAPPPVPKTANPLPGPDGTLPDGDAGRPE